MNFAPAHSPFEESAPEFADVREAAALAAAGQRVVFSKSGYAAVDQYLSIVEQDGLGRIAHGQFDSVPSVVRECIFYYTTHGQNNQSFFGGNWPKTARKTKKEWNFIRSSIEAEKEGFEPSRRF